MVSKQEWLSSSFHGLKPSTIAYDVLIPHTHTQVLRMVVELTPGDQGRLSTFREASQVVEPRLCGWCSRA